MHVTEYNMYLLFCDMYKGLKIINFERFVISGSWSG